LGIILLSSNLLAQISGGGYEESYLLRDIGARAIGMGGAYTAIVNEPSALFFNPAGLTSLSNRAMITTSFSLLQLGRTQDFAAYGQSFGKFGIGASFNNYNTASIIGTDIRGKYLGNFTNVQYALNVGAAYAMEFASIGIGLKYLSNSLNYNQTSANGFAVDLGMKFDVAGLFSFGLSMQNIASTISWNNNSKDNSNIPFSIRAGIGMEFPFNEKTISSRTTSLAVKDTLTEPSSRYFLVSFDAVYHQYQIQPNFILGLEYVPFEIIAIRGGITVLGDNSGNLAFFPMNSWGTGISLRPAFDGLPFGFHIDYSIGSDYLSNSKMVHHFSIFLQF